MTVVGLVDAAHRRHATTPTGTARAASIVRRLLVLAAASAAVVFAVAPPASAHPLGNFTTNVYAGLIVGPDTLSVDYVLDLAEIPALRARADIDDNGDDEISDRESSDWAAKECGRLAPMVDVRVDSASPLLAVGRSSLAFPPGQAGISTLRLECRLETPLEWGLRVGSRISLNDRTFADRIGWREVTAIGDGVTLSRSDAPSRSISGRLTRYPGDQLSSPREQRTATVVARPGGPRVTEEERLPLAEVPGVSGAVDALTELVSDRRITLPFVAVALLVAIVLGAMHAIAPGHGKTVIAAYLVGQRGDRSEALALGLTVAATHTAGVLALGVALSMAASFAPERLYPWLGVASGGLVAAIGGGLLVRAWRLRSIPVLQHGHGLLHHHHEWEPEGEPEHERVAVAAPPVRIAAGIGARHAGSTNDDGRDTDADGHAHHSHGGDHTHDHDHAHDHHRDRNEPAHVGRRGVIAMGFAGGLVPSPSALVVLLGAIALGRAWFGVLVIAAYGVGMAVTLVVAGLLLARLRDWLESLLTPDRPRLLAAARVLPALTAVLVLVGGVVLVARAGVTL